MQMKLVWEDPEPLPCFTSADIIPSKRHARGTRNCRAVLPGRIDVAQNYENVSANYENAG